MSTGWLSGIAAQRRDGDFNPETFSSLPSAGAGMRRAARRSIQVAVSEMSNRVATEDIALDWNSGDQGDSLKFSV